MARSTAAVAKEKKRLRQLRRAQTDLYWLLLKLGYGWNPALQQGITRGFHEPICGWITDNREHPRQALFAQRSGLKTTLLIGEYIQEILRDPDTTILHIHDVEEEAELTLQEVGNHLMQSEFLRSLEPIGIYPEGHPHAGEPYRVLPLKSNKKFLKAASFTVRRAGFDPTTKRQATMRAKGAGSEITGTHVRFIGLDDIYGFRRLMESTGTATLSSWYRKSVLNVLSPGGRIRLRATRWDENDFYGKEVINNPEWAVMVRHARETNGEMDYHGLPVLYGPTADGGDGLKEAIKREEIALQEMGTADYSAQRMNDPAPASEIPWVLGSQNYCTLAEASGPGTIFVLSDPAPYQLGGFKGLKEKQRGDGTKDYWSIAVVKLRVNGMRQEIILLDGVRSQEWDIDPGCDVACGLMKKWGTNKFYSENPMSYFKPMLDAARRNGISIMRARDNGPLKYADYNKADRKNETFKALAGKAKQDEFYICESCPGEFLHGDKVHTGFLTQAEKWRPLPGNRNNLRFDDDADVVARATDAALQEFAPQIQKFDADNPFRFAKEMYPDRGTRYIRWGGDA